MGWFDEQIRERMKSDQEVLEDSFLQIVDSVIGNHTASRLASEQMVAKEALDDVLKYYHYKPVEVPDNIRDVNEQMDYVLRPLGLMTRNVTLEEGWYKDAFGPMIGYRASDGTPVPLFPKPYRGYWFLDETGHKTTVNAGNAHMFRAAVPHGVRRKFAHDREDCVGR